MFSRAKKTRHAVDALVAEVDALRTLVNEQTARIDAEATRQATRGSRHRNETVCERKPVRRG